ncbi:MAG: FliH/SctL family protein [Planctomycetota bacterium]|nr:FliH/SctL family protein [Planctomycetota bacterium]
MPLIPQADRKQIPRDAVAFNMTDLAREGEAILVRAREEAQRILREAAAERERLLGQARAEGQKEGLAKGVEKGRAEGIAQGRSEALDQFKVALAKLEKSWNEALAGFIASRDTMLADTRDDLLALALLISHRVTGRQLATDPAVAASQVESVLTRVVTASKLRIEMHSADAELVRQALPELMRRHGATQNVEIVATDAVPRGGCVAKLAHPTRLGGTIDASILTALDHVAEQLVPARRAELAEAARAALAREDVARPDATGEAS